MSIPMSIPMTINFITEMNIRELRKHVTPREVQTLPVDEVVTLASERATRKTKIDESAEREAIALKTANVFRTRQTTKRGSRISHVLLNRERRIF